MSLSSLLGFDLRQPSVALGLCELIDDYFAGSTKRLAIFVGILFVLPVSFLLSGLWVGPILQ